MHHVAERLGLALAFVLCLSALPLQTGALTLDEVAWENVSGLDNTIVVFTLIFSNPAQVPSEPVEGTINAQEFGAFLPDVDLICEFSIPSLPPGETYEVECRINLGELPETPERLDAAGNRQVIGTGGAPLPPPGTPGVIIVSCPLPDFWGGGVDVEWTGDGGGQVIVHRGILPVCSGRGPSYIFTNVGCEAPEGAAWSFSDVCPGWTPNLVTEEFGQAPNPLPPGPWTGWIAVESDLPLGEFCEFKMDLSCGIGVAEINITAEICDCDAVLPLEPATWGQIKSLYPE